MSRLFTLATASSLVTLLALALAPACGTSDAAPSGPASPKAQPASASPDAKALCVEVFSRNRTCTDQYIPALVDLRAKYDKPAGIAAEVAADRDGIIAIAKTEWATDSQPAAIDATCTSIAAQLGAGDPADITAAQACLAITDCAAYTACIMPQFEKRFAH